MRRSRRACVGHTESIVVHFPRNYGVNIEKLRFGRQSNAHPHEKPTAPVGLAVLYSSHSQSKESLVVAPRFAPWIIFAEWSRWIWWRRCCERRSLIIVCECLSCFPGLAAVQTRPWFPPVMRRLLRSPPHPALPCPAATEPKIVYICIVDQESEILDTQTQRSIINPKDFFP